MRVNKHQLELAVQNHSNIKITHVNRGWVIFLDNNTPLAGPFHSRQAAFAFIHSKGLNLNNRYEPTQESFHADLPKVSQASSDSSPINLIHTNLGWTLTLSDNTPLAGPFRTRQAAAAFASRNALSLDLQDQSEDLMSESIDFLKKLSTPSKTTSEAARPVKDYLPADPEVVKAEVRRFLQLHPDKSYLLQAIPRPRGVTLWDVGQALRDLEKEGDVKSDSNLRWRFNA